MKALVTGGLGFIGSHLVDALVAEGASVTILDSLDPRVHGEAPVPPEGVRLVVGDVRDPRALDEAIGEGVDVVFHQAAMVGVGRGAPDARGFVDANVQGTILLMERLARAPPERVVLASTMALYGEGAYECPACGEPRGARRSRAQLDAGRWDPTCPACGTPLHPRPVTEEHAAQPGTAYAVSKQAQEAMVFSLGRDLGVPVVALRYHNVYGPRMPTRTPYAGVAAHFKSRILDGLPPLVTEDGAQLRDFVRVEDVARANLLAARTPVESVAFEAFHVGTGRPRPILDLATGLCRALRPDLTPERPGIYRNGDARHVFASIEKARRLLRYEPTLTLEEGTRRFAREPVRAPPQEATP